MVDSSKKCYVILEKSWAWNDSSYFLEEEDLGYPNMAFSSYTRAQKAKEALEFKRWQVDIQDIFDGGTLWLYLDRLNLHDRKYLEKSFNEKTFNIRNLSQEAYLWLRNEITTILEKKFHTLTHKLTDKKWRSYLGNKVENPLSNLNIYLDWSIQQRINSTLQLEGYDPTKNISPAGLRRFQELVYEYFTQLPEFYYIQEAVLTEG